jgi:hypothetical protein
MPLVCKKSALRHNTTNIGWLFNPKRTNMTNQTHYQKAMDAKRIATFLYQ